MVNLGAKTSSA